MTAAIVTMEAGGSKTWYTTLAMMEICQGLLWIVEARMRSSSFQKARIAQAHGTVASAVE